MTVVERCVAIGFMAFVATALFDIHRRTTENNKLTYRMGWKIMAQVSIEQEDLDEVATALNELTAAISEIDTTQLPPADQSRLQAALTGLTASVNSKLPVDVEPGDDAVPATPVVEPTDEATPE